MSGIMYSNKEWSSKFQSAFVNALNMHRRLSVAAAMDLAKGVSMDMTVGDVDRVLDYLVEKNLISFSRVHELFYLGALPELDAKQQPLPAEMVERLLSSVVTLKNEVAELKKSKV